MAIFLVLHDYSLLQSIIFGFGSGVGFTLAITIMGSIREELKYANIPRCLQGAGLTLIIAGILALIFVGFSGLIQVQ
jgi:Na+-transporting NADH:ubiquinone oxidoreductase subunit NqrE